MIRVGILLPGFSAGPDDWAIPVQLNLARVMAQFESVRVLALRYPHLRGRYTVYGAEVQAMGFGQARGLRRLLLWWRALSLIERLHRQFLEVVKTELDRQGIEDINNVQALILFN
ncbi:MAG: hypothetical protein JNM70_23670, partial [Anaerolineae bacterium]|nr:hypothetical protein [Anaerolineae bacterium]